MQKLLLLLVAAAFFSSCGGGGDEKKKTTETSTTDNTQNPDYKKGLALVTSPNNQCLTCHAIDKSIQGPAYREVANRYANYPDTIIPYLAHKIINGGNGNWGEIFMTQNNVSQEDAEAMVKYILLLKK